ncbi:MAG: glycoside hydrolase family 65 [Acidobacteriia bacterium]|nr:glycoside hydrolase family 65 [Terriglobia bacterium]
MADAAAGKLDRRAIVSRHNPTLHDLDPRAPLSVGNGEFAFTSDVTGLQSLADIYERNVPLCTQSQWGWHSFPMPAGLHVSDLRLETFDTYGRPVGYAASSQGQEPLFNWLRENPHRLNLGRLAFLLDGARLNRQDVTAIDQKLDLWTGTLISRFALRGQPVEVKTCCHPTRDVLAVSVESPLLGSGRLSVEFHFPYGSPAMNASDWTAAGRHTTTVSSRGPNQITVHRQLDADAYWVWLHWLGAARFEERGDHRLRLSGNRLDFTCEFTAREPAPGVILPGAAQQASETHWREFWSNGGAVDLSAGTDARAPELERRIVLSQYLTAIQCSGSTPPQETGLTCNSWYGKFHLEMHWWHAAHFADWGRASLLERSMGWYASILPSARDKAKQQGYRGARWPKMTALDGRSSPSSIGELLIWQQPHPIALAELCYRARPARETLDRYAEIVMESAEFMADFAVRRDGRFVLGPPVIPAQENHPPRETWNPTFELAYWREALGIAANWRHRLGMRPPEKWEQVRAGLARLPVREGVYLAHENCPQTYTARNFDHPSMLAAYGMRNGEGVDRETMRRTLHRVLREWRWADTWGWDFPMAAMTAGRLGEPVTAVDCLFLESPKNTWLPNGHNPQRADLPLYLPGNGGLLMAVALLARLPNGFPKKGWKARYEGFSSK